VSTLAEKAGEMFMVGFAGTDPEAAAELIQRYHAGGVILFSRNIGGAADTKALCEGLQRLRREVSDSPLFIAIDQEGGCVARITEGVTVFPGNMALGATGSERLTRQAGTVMASELSALGINVNLAPVLDISSNPRNPGIGARSFGFDPELAARLGTAAIEGMQENGVFAAAKHFPGLGEALVDSHDQLPVVHASAAQLEERELKPFRAAIAAGATFIMTAHCAYSALDPSLAPATLSRPILSDLLRERLRFEGIVITDCLEMASIENRFSTPDAALTAVRAGATMLLVCHTREKQITAIETLGRAVERGDIPGQKIDAATATIASAKSRLQFFPDSSGDTDPQHSLSGAIALEAITVADNKDAMIPLRLDASEKLAVIAPAFDALTKVEEAAEPHEVLLKELRHRCPSTYYRKVSVRPSASEADECFEMCKNADKLLIITYNLHLYPAQREFVGRLLGLGKPAVVAAVRDPYDLAFVSEASARVATYSFRACSLRALVKVLFGESEANGTLPVELHL